MVTDVTTLTVLDRSETVTHQLDVYDVDGEDKYTLWFCHVWLAFYHIPPTCGVHS
jgi:hypothetical protein